MAGRGTSAKRAVRLRILPRLEKLAWRMRRLNCWLAQIGCVHPTPALPPQPPIAWNWFWIECTKVFITYNILAPQLGYVAALAMAFALAGKDANPTGFWRPPVGHGAAFAMVFALAG